MVVVGGDYMAGNKRTRIKILKYLSEKGRASTTEIASYLNNTTKHGVSSNQLANVLAKSPFIEKVGSTLREHTTGWGRYEICVWGLTTRGEEKVRQINSKDD